MKDYMKKNHYKSNRKLVNTKSAVTSRYNRFIKKQQQEGDENWYSQFLHSNRFTRQKILAENKTKLNNMSMIPRNHVAREKLKWHIYAMNKLI